ncbi:glycerol-3-phosphate acyltransferase [Oscillatoria sp. CS-180]|uniref:glycerol-3-phosphate acyltransferase n=1 Tax=Oscillatoria sp. CS-180 TaxID=3021720 RepID=UPI00232E9BBA|nr:glycerol-3-phosphate acyltransferase [Oscillatoria sp. CS-180]MDB9526413.1 glycerol-3-phosphate acyltransferase [Oscillatoria sp. CS-180]
MPSSTTWTASVLCIVAFGVGGLPIISWIVEGLAQKRLADLGTGNISVSAAFYHGGTRLGLLAVLSEALKGIAVVTLARSLFPVSPAWEIVALIALVVGRYVVGRGAGTTNVVWGYIVHDWVGALIIFVVSGTWFAIVRRRQQGRLFVLILIPIVELLRRPGHPAAIASTIILSLLLAWIYRQIPDDLSLASTQPASDSRRMFEYFRGRDVIKSLSDKPQVQQMGRKAATLAELKQAGYAVPPGWILPAASGVRSLVSHLESIEVDPWQQPWIVRSSAISEDSESASAAGQYETIAHVSTRAALTEAVEQCRASYHRPEAEQYRRDRGLEEQSGIALLVQKQVEGVYSGVAFSRDPVEQGNAVIVEALAGGADQIVSGRVTPQQYRVDVDEVALTEWPAEEVSQWEPASITLEALNQGLEDSVPSTLIQQVARLARHLELYYHGIPQDIEWSFDGETLWLLQARPITTLVPIWTRKIAAEVIPGVIRPLTWSINRPLTCGVWGEIFTIVLGDRAAGLDFKETATLHYSRAYFNATLLGDIFRRMGLPPESLEFLTLGSPFSKPPILSTLKNVPGLLRLLGNEWSLIQEFSRNDRQQFAPVLQQLRQGRASSLPVSDCVQRTDLILDQLKTATYYNILAPLSFALRRALFQVPETALDPSQQPEIASVQAIKTLATSARQQYPHLLDLSQGEGISPTNALFKKLSTEPSGQSLLTELNQLVEHYGYLSEVGTDIAIPTWQEDPQPVRDLFTQFFLNPPNAPDRPEDTTSEESPQGDTWQYRQVQSRLNLKGRVATVYLMLLAELRWSLLRLEEHAIAQGLLLQAGDAFFLTLEELKQGVAGLLQASTLQAVVEQRRSQFTQRQQWNTVPFIVYGNDPPADPTRTSSPLSINAGVLQGIGASAGQVEGPVKILNTLQLSTPLPPNTIIVVPYTDAGWAPILAQAAGLIAEVGGRLSHGAIVAREYRIPAVMNIAQATQQFQDGEVVRIDGRVGTVERVQD